MAGTLARRRNMLPDLWYGPELFPNRLSELFPRDMLSPRESIGYNFRIDENQDLVFTMPIPGVSKEDVSISAIPEDRMLMIQTPNHTIRRTISTDYSLDDVYASVKNGLLELKIPQRKKDTLEIQVH